MDFESRLMGVVRGAVDDGKLGVDDVMGIVQRILQIVKEAADENRAKIEEIADAAVLWLATKIPNQILGAVVSSTAPRLIDLALDEVFGPDADNT